MKTKKLIITEDGSHTLFIPELNEHYHSIHGAVAESRHVFIEAGLKPKMIENKKLNVLEVGLGTGLNAALALVAAEENQIQLNYFAVEPYPISTEDMMQLNYSKVSESTRMNEVIPAIHAASRDNEVHIGPYFIFHYFEKRIQDIAFENDFFDLIFFDAFSPGVQPEMWTMDVFQKIAAAMKPGAVLVTYVAKGEVRRTMKACGLSIEKLPGFGGKREMTRATKNVF
ncbi:MAG: tRNA (5-methylaminomethyl-2-thiouridine)(34)-methyltransferase MnmD [Bacteroidales bacterium]